MLSVCWCILIIRSVLSQSNECKWETEDANLDLSLLGDTELPIDCYSSSGNWVMFYTPCKNELGCSPATNNETERFMITHYSLNTGNCHLYLAKWEGNDKFLPYKHYDNTGNPMYTFNYTNGYSGNDTSADNCENGRHINISYICDNKLKDANVIYDPETVNCLKYPDDDTPAGLCLYTVNIYTYLACDGESNNDGGNDNNGLGAGWIFVIVMSVLFILYCIIGYVYNWRKSNTGLMDCKNNIPCKALWERPYLLICFCCCNKTGYENEAMLPTDDE